MSPSRSIYLNVPKRWARPEAYPRTSEAKASMNGFIKPTFTRSASKVMSSSSDAGVIVPKMWDCRPSLWCTSASSEKAFFSGRNSTATSASPRVQRLQPMSRTCRLVAEICGASENNARAVRLPVAEPEIRALSI